MMITLLLLAHLQFPAQAETKPLLPTLNAETLEGKDFHIPKDFVGSSAVVILGFSKGSRASTARCADLLEKDFPGSTYTIAEIQGAPFFIKGFIKNGIRSNVSEARRSKYLILTEGKSELKKLSKFEDKSEDDAYIFLLAENANHVLEISEQLHTQCTTETYPALKANVQSLMKK